MNDLCILKRLEFYNNNFNVYLESKNDNDFVLKEIDLNEYN